MEQEHFLVIIGQVECRGRRQKYHGCNNKCWIMAKRGE
jgi:hypothetical protein